MAFIPAEKTVKVLFKSTYLGQELLNVLWFTWEDAITGSMLADLATALYLWSIDFLKPLCSPALDNYEIQVIQQDANDSPMVSVLGFGVGTRLGDPLPGNVALVTTFDSLNRGKSHRGRMYLGGLTTDAIDPTDQNNAFADFIVDYMDAWDNLGTSLGSITPVPIHVIASHFIDKAPRVTAATYAVIGYRINSAFDSQRRRLRGRGR